MKLKELGKRVLVASWGIPLILFSIWYGKLLLVAIVALVIGFGQYEYYQLSRKKGAQPLVWPGIIGGFLIVLSFYFLKESEIFAELLIFILVVLHIELFRNQPNPILNQAVTIGGLIYPTLFFPFLIAIRELPQIANLPYQVGAQWLFAIIATTWVCDTAAYFAGSALGRHKLFKRVSPNKTWEGSIFGFIFSLITMLAFHFFWLEEIAIHHLLVIGAVCGIFGQIGDLAESLLKRDAGEKDSSHILPGHGGFLDRFDSLFFSAPIAYFYLKYIVFSI